MPACAGDVGAQHRSLASELRSDPSVARVSTTPAWDHDSGRIVSTIELEPPATDIPPGVLGTLAEHGFAVFEASHDWVESEAGIDPRMIVSAWWGGGESATSGSNRQPSGRG